MSDKQWKCRKCGWTEVSVVYEPEQKGPHPYLGTLIEPHPERLYLTCLRCSFSWHDKPLDFFSELLKDDECDVSS